MWGFVEIGDKRRRPRALPSLRRSGASVELWGEKKGVKYGS